MSDEHFLVSVGDFTDMWYPWQMTIDLTEMCGAAGKKIKYADQDKGCQYWGVDLPVPQFKKALKLIHRYSDDDQRGRVQKYLDEHFPRWGKEFGKLR